MGGGGEECLRRALPRGVLLIIIISVIVLRAPCLR